MVVALLMAFYNTCQCQPEKLIFFRDGVSEGELAAVQSKEIPQVPIHSSKLSCHTCQSLTRA